MLPILSPAYQLKASVRTDTSFEKLSWDDKYQLNEANDYFDPSFYETDIIIIAAPPREGYEKSVEKLLSHIHPKTQIILLSSTSVYDQTEGEVVENDTNKAKKVSKMLKMERFLQKKWQNLLILRLGGLMGYDRIAGRHSSGKVFEHDGYVNYIHRDDVVQIIKQLIDNEVTGDIINVVAPQHPSKKAIFVKNSKKFGFALPTFKSDAQKSKQVSSQKLQKTYNYRFLKPDPAEFW